MASSRPADTPDGPRFARALDEAALYVSRADDAATALEQMFTVCDRLITGIAAS